MMYHRLGLIHKDQRGLTLTELILAIAITAIITAVITLTIFQMMTGSVRTNNHMTAVRQVQSAGYWVSHDAQMAQSITPPGGGFPLTLTWEEWEEDSNNHEVVYSLVDMPNTELKKLQREYVTEDTEGNVTTEVAFVAEYIDTGQTSCTLDEDEYLLIFTVTATVGGGMSEESETRTYEVMPRPD
jgi:prepilin-type N-terminal cleavage/methylation domain-containing protein